MIHRYKELRPDQVEEVLAQSPLAIVPWGALEWHGPHLPLGLDGIVAEHFCERLAERIGGVLLPTCWCAITTLPHRFSLQVPTSAVQSILDDTLSGLARAGAETVLLVTGHYAHGHHFELYGAAVRAMERQSDLLVFAGTPLEPLGDPSLLDHAARYETSQLLAIRPELVNTEALPAAIPPEPDVHSSLDPKSYAVLGEDPRLATAEEGRTLIEKGLTAWQNWICNAGRADLAQHYAASRAQYEAYVAAYCDGSWEEAILKWWDAK